MEFARCRTGTATAFGILTQDVSCPTVQAARKPKRRFVCFMQSITGSNREEFGVRRRETRPRRACGTCPFYTCTVRTVRMSTSRRCIVASGTCLCIFCTWADVRPLAATRLYPHTKFGTSDTISCPHGRSSPRTTPRVRTR
jgi:hypothetical protein